MNDPFVIRGDKIKGASLSRDKRLSWTEGIFETAGSGQMTLGSERSQFLGSAISEKKIKLFLVISLLLLASLLGRSFYLQTVKGAYYHNLAEGNRLRISSLPASRGVIFDRTGQQLVKNVPDFNLLITPADLPADTVARLKVLTEVSSLVNLSVAEINNLISEHEPYIYQPILIKSGLDYQATLRGKLKEAEWPGVSLTTGSRRDYLLASGEETAYSLAHVLGYNGQLSKTEYEKHAGEGYFLNDQIGKTGLELYYEKELKGYNGQKQVEVDALGREKEIIGQTEAIAGQDLILNIDYGLQKEAEKALSAALKSFNKRRGAVVALNPQNGEILALVSLPAYDSNKFSAGISVADYSLLSNNPERPLFNRVVSGAYPSGSTIKPVMATAALAEGVITPQTTFNSVGGIKILDWFFPDWKAGGHGITNVYKAIAESVNTFFYMIGGGYPADGNPTHPYQFNGLGPEKITAWLKKFGLGTATGIDLNGEADGFVPSVEWKNKTTGEQWYIGDTYNLSIGQGNLLVTPLQVASWTATVANGGTIYQPQLVKKIGEWEVAPKALAANLAPAEYLAVARAGMRQAVTAGSARSFATLPIEVAAKTGTAQWNNNKAPHAWFTCFAPYQNPQIVVTVLIEEGEEGSRTAAPVAWQILNYYGKQLQN
ncbi:MAG: penicillin-binding protein 2 [Patescibacteria group bacterium]|jgi:penicillin-binding protein 2